MAQYRTSRIVPVILTITIIIVVIIGLVSLARLIFSPSGSSNPVEIDISRRTLLDTSAGSAVSMTVRGPIVADENFRSYKITASPTSRQMNTYKGYLDTVLDQKDFANNTAAYDEFVHALDKANMTVSRPITEERNDVRGTCATGRVYEFQVIKDNEAKQTLWTSTCSGSPGSLKASATQLTELFLNQIPDGDKLVRDLSI